MSENQNDVVLEVKNITKRFPGVLANDQISFNLKRGEIHALLGENGAGKSTLMNVIYGLYKPDEGQIFIEGKETEIENPIDAIQQGIGMVHQHFMLVPVFTVLENIVLGSEIVSGPMLNMKKARQEIGAIVDKYGLELDLDAVVEDLPVGVQQRVEIVKLLYRNADILILDEPTAVLTPQEADELFDVMLANLIEAGKSVIFITHKLREVLEFADRITVIRLGKVVGTTLPLEADQKKLASMMVGREVVLNVDKKEASPGEPVLHVKDYLVKDDRQQVSVNGVSFEVHAGEILGIAGVQGNGQTELVEALTGMRHTEGGYASLLGQDITNADPRTVTALGTGYIPEDRQRDGLVLSYSIYENMALREYYLEPFAKGIVLDEAAMLQNSVGLIEKFDVRTPDAETKAGLLSGGNQQKVIIAREFTRETKLVVAAQPTRGLDVGSIEYIHSRLIEKRDQGAAVLLVSSELDEVIQLSDRIAVMYRGKILAVVDAKTATKEQIGLLMAGVVPADS